MDSKKKIYEQLKKEYTDEEIADAHLLSEELSEEELAAAHEEMRQIRLEQLKNRTEEQRLHSELFRLRILIREYLEQETYQETQSFGKYLEEYIHILRKTKKAFAEDIDIHQTRLSRILHDREDPNIELLYRLEIHSGNLIPAILWWKLFQKKQAYELTHDEEGRKREATHVKNALTFST